MTAGSLSYRREIDGLRTLAVLPVILFHAGFSAFSGGFVGVDVFFVISGYLITTIILREQGEGRFSILKFYERRARRILPALFVVVLACVPLALAWMPPWQLLQFGRSIMAVVLFGSNFLFWTESGYFASDAEQKPLLHTWSLAVEEQYYILFPLAVMLFWRLGPRGLAALIAFVAALSLGLTELGWRYQPSANFYLLPTRAWELLAGSLLAIWLLRRERPTGVWAEAGGGLGIALIVWSILSFDERTPFPSLLALIPVGGSVLVILCAGPTTWAGRLLGWGPMVGIGLISYSAYLWHQPLFAFARIRSIEAPAPALMGALALLSLGLAWLSWRFVETRFRNPVRAPRRVIFGGAAVGGALLLAIGGVAVAGGGWPSRLPPEVLEMAAQGQRGRKALPGCEKRKDLGFAYCVFSPERQQRIALWGDSHGLALAPELAKSADSSGYGLVNLAELGCLPVQGVYAQGRERCIDRNARIVDYLQRPDSPEIVVIVARWAPAFLGTAFDNGEGGAEPPERVVYLSTRTGPEHELPADEMGAEIRSTVKLLLAAGKRVVVVGSTPEVGWRVPDTLAKVLWFKDRGDLPNPLSTSAAVFEARNRPAATAFGRLDPDPALAFVDPSPLFCGKPIAGRCIAEWNGRPLYSDDDHVSPLGARRVADLVVSRLPHAADAAGR